jgi:uncharacterized surface protein with fasciclin (FAS1) repeats
MLKFKTVLASAVTAAVLATGMSTAGADSMSYSKNMGAAPMAKADIIDTAVGAGQFNTLAKALTAAGLVDTLKGPGPFTVFAPTDEAFAKIPPEKLNALLADKAALTKVLTYHVLSGKLVAAEAPVGEDVERAIDEAAHHQAGMRAGSTVTPWPSGPWPRP